MGYDLHITRKHDWADHEGPLIDLAEWEAVIHTDPDLTPDASTDSNQWISASFRGEEGALAWYGGEILSKYPSKELIVKMFSIAQRLEAKVQGDDGEIYGEDGSSVNPEPAAVKTAEPGLINRICRWFLSRRAIRKQQRSTPQFHVGDRVRNVWGQQGTVLSVDKRANGGLGSLRVRLDDGHEQHMAFIASGFEIVNET